VRGLRNVDSTFFFALSCCHSVNTYEVAIRQSLSVVVLVHTAHEVSSVGFWMHHNIVILADYLACS